MFTEEIMKNLSPSWLDVGGNIPDLCLEAIHENRIIKKNRIKFKSAIYKRRVVPDQLTSSSNSYISLNGEVDEDYFSDDYSAILDSTTCYHPKCSFAYNLSLGNLRKPSLVAESIPVPTYQRLAKLWGIDPLKTPRKFGNKCQVADPQKENEQLERYIKFVERDIGIQSELSEDLQVDAESTQIKPGILRPTEVKENPYLKFLRKDLDSEHRQEAKANLRKKAKKITKRIIQTFLDWYQSLGGNDGETLLDESTLEELFQIGFDMPEAKALVVRIKELPTVPECLATLRNEPEHATRYALRQLLQEDIQREKIPLKMFAFGSMLPKENPPLRYKPPRNFVRDTWMECSRVPKDMDSMKTIWIGLEKLRSTVAFANWLKNHPHIKPPAYLQQKGLLKINYEEWNQIYKGFEVEIDTAEYVPSVTKYTKERSSAENARMSSSSFEKSDSFLSY